MILLDATVDAPADGRLVVNLPPGSPDGPVRVLVTDAVADPANPDGAAKAGPWPTVPPAPPGPRGSGFAWLAPHPDFGKDWDPNETFRREDMYGDDGR